MPPEALLALWQLTSPQRIADTPRATIWQVTRPDGKRAALKLLHPDQTEEARGARYLVALEGRGAVRVLASQGEAILMEWCDGPSLGDLVRAGHDVEATQRLVDTIRTLHAAPIDPGLLEPLATRLGPLTDVPQTGDFATAADRARSLLATNQAVNALHGDLHHDNVLRSARGWLAIDPKDVLGDPAYKPANAFRNPDGAGDLIFDPTRILQMAEAFSQGLDQPRARILGWAAAHCALSILWSRENGQDPIDDLCLLPLLLTAADRAG